MRERVYDKNGTGYRHFTEDELWHWHAYDYGFRRAYFENLSATSPIDIEGKRYNTLLADRAELMFREVLAEHHRKLAAVRRELFNAERYRLAEEWRQSPEAQLDPAIARTGPRKAWGFKSPAEALGVKAREYAPDEMRASASSAGDGGIGARLSSPGAGRPGRKAGD